MTGDPSNPSPYPDPIGGRREDDLDRPLLSYMPAVGKNWKNWRLEGSGFSPIAIYVILLGIVVLWFLGACLLSFLGPIVMLLLGAGLFAVTAYLSKRAADRDARAGMGLCPKCAYDLRATEEKCPECGTAVPDEIVRRRRSLDRMRAMQGGVTVASPVSAVEHQLDPTMFVVPRPAVVDLSPIPLEDPPEEKATLGQPDPLKDASADPGSPGITKPS